MNVPILNISMRHTSGNDTEQVTPAAYFSFAIGSMPSSLRTHSLVVRDSLILSAASQQCQATHVSSGEKANMQGRR